MEITRLNFKEKLDEIEQAISHASFLAVDTEFTGLSESGNVIHGFDTPEERYRKLRTVASQFLVLQFGLAAFEYDAENNRYISKAFNFYTFPRPFSRQAPDVRFLSQCSSIDFLSSQGFDFNKTFKDGVSYLLPDDAARMRENLRQRHEMLEQQRLQDKMRGSFSSPAFQSPTNEALAASKGPSLVPDEHKAYIDGVCQQIETFLKSKDEEVLALEPCNGYLRKLTYQSVAQRFASGVHLEAKTDDRRMRYIQVSRVSSEEDMRKREEAKRRAEFEELDDAVGFTKVIQLLTKSGKLVVGHNMILDVLFIINQFVSPLPEDYEEFKALTKCALPRILDTKYVACTNPLREHLPRTSLAELLSDLKSRDFPKPDTAPAADFPAYDLKNEKLHEAGYDAYITGLCFINMSAYLGNLHKPTLAPITPESHLVTPYVNKLFLMRVHDIPFMNLAGDDLSPSRDHVFHVQFPKDWKASDLCTLFSPFGGIQIAWLDEMTALVGLYKREHASMVSQNLGPSDLYRVTTYREYAQGRGALSTPRHPPSLKRRPSPVSDVDLPSKRRRAPNVESPFPPNHSSMTTIMEESEGDSGADGPAARRDRGAQGEDLGEAVTREASSRKRKHDNGALAGGGGNKLFEEPGTW